MTAIQLVRDKDDPHIFDMPTFGRVQFPRSPRGEVLITVPDKPQWRVNMDSGMRRPAHRAIEGETEVATFTQRDKRLVAGSRELVLVGKKGSFLKAGPWAVTEQGRDIATIPRLYWGRSKITVTVIDEATARLDPRLTLFALWCASKISTTVVL